MQIPPPQTVDPNVPATIPPDRLQDFKGFLDIVLETVIGGAAPDVLALGLQLWAGLGAVTVAWTGLRIAFSGTFEPWALVRLVLAVAIPRTLLHYYALPIPGVGLSFPATVAAGGTWLQNLFISDVVSVGYTELTALLQAFAGALGAAWSTGSLVSVVTEGVSVLLSSLLTLADGRAHRARPRGALQPHLRPGHLGAGGARDHRPARTGLHPLAPLRADELPLLGMVPDALMTYTLYGVVAGAVLRVFMGVGMGYVTTYTGALMGTGTADPAELGLWAAVLLPLVVSGLMAGLKVGELSAMLVSGSGSVGSGITALVVRGGAKAAPARAAAGAAGG